MFDQTVVQVYQGQKDGLGPRISDFPDEDDFVGTDKLCDIVVCILRLPMVHRLWRTTRVLNRLIIGLLSEFNWEEKTFLLNKSPRLMFHTDHDCIFAISTLPKL